MEKAFEIKLPVFEGPFDLLLFFIERDEVDINNIPIFTITNDFLDYIHQLEKLNIEVASEFILVASTLMQIKARMLLPRPDLDESGNEIDPREELARRLLEYKKFKEVSEIFRKYEEQRLMQEKRGNIANELKAISKKNFNVEEELQDIDIYKIFSAYQKAMNKFSNRENTVIHTITPFPFTVEEQKFKIIDKLKAISKLSFEEMMSEFKSRIELIFNFIAILELLQEKRITIQIGLGYNNFKIENYLN